MRISRDVDGLRFVGQCNSERGFMPCYLECLRCGQRIDPHAPGGQVSLTCLQCGVTAREFWSEAQMYVYLAENWNALRQACTHPGVTTLQAS